MMHSEVGEACKMNAHHVPLRKTVEELDKSREGVRRGGHDESERNEGEV